MRTSRFLATVAVTALAVTGTAAVGASSASAAPASAGAAVPGAAASGPIECNPQKLMAKSNFHLHRGGVLPEPPDGRAAKGES